MIRAAFHTALVAALLTVAIASMARAERAHSVVVIGIDGMDPGLLSRFMAEGRMPNFQELAREGSLDSLETSIPPQSPVAWSNFITGMDPGGHGIFDFIHRDASTYTPVFSAADVVEPARTLSIGEWVLPLSKGGTVLLRKGEAFWQILDRRGVECTVIRVPANYPPADTRGHSLAGMGTPDLLGTYGTFSFFTDNPSWQGAQVSGGRIHMVELVDDGGRALLEGPRNSLRKDGRPLSREMRIDRDPDHDAARMTVGDSETLLHSGEWSDWVPVDFRVAGPFKKVHAMVRFYLRSVSPLELYVSPLNLDPEAPALPISTPGDYARELAARVGRYYTQGIAEDTKALEAGVFDDAEFVAQTDTLLAERARLLDAVLDEYRGGFLFFYVSTIDQSCHALWRNADPAHPAHPTDAAFADRFGELYEEMDAMLGRIRARIPRDATLVVMSDHGFAPYYQKVNLNSWLYQNQYLALVRSDEIGQHPLFNNVFWRRTKAYAAGINGLYVNLAGRESKGIVPQGAQYEALMDELARGLLSLRDPETGAQVITTVYRARDVYHGDQTTNAPDLVIGYNRGYRSSDDSALGTITRDVITPNLGKWTGDHCIDHRWVPGIVLTNRRLSVLDPSLLDMPVTILADFGVPAPVSMTGRNVFAGAAPTPGR